MVSFWSSCRSLAPAPLAAWYVDATIRLTLYFRWRGKRGMRRIVAAQLGEAASLAPRNACALISGMMRGSESRKAELESTTRHLDFGIHSLDTELPAQKNARSMPSREVSSSILISPISLPADHLDAKQRRFATGNCRFFKRRRISWPTAPVAPTTATFNGIP